MPIYYEDLEKTKYLDCLGIEDLRGQCVHNKIILNAENTDFEGAVLYGCYCASETEGAIIINPKMSEDEISIFAKGKNLKRAKLEKANLKRANLEGADLRAADLEGANLQGVNLENANLTGAYLEGANLENANLTWADFKNATLIGANLKGADIQYANFKNTEISIDEIFLLNQDNKITKEQTAGLVLKCHACKEFYPEPKSHYGVGWEYAMCEDCYGEPDDSYDDEW